MTQVLSSPSVARNYDAIVIGGGHNGLVTAAYLGRAGLKTLVLERREVIGGGAATEEIWPGFRVDTGAHRMSGFNQTVVRELELERHGLQIIRADPTVFAPLLDGRHLVLSRDPRTSIEAIREFSTTDADRWTAFGERVTGIARLLETVHAMTPPSLPDTTPRDLWKLLRAGARLRRLGKKEMAEVLRTLPMSVAEFLDEWFETDVLKGTLGAVGIAGLNQGPLASGTAYAFLHHHVGSANGTVRSTEIPRGGMGNLTQALKSAGAVHGVEVRTGAEVERVIVANDRATGVALVGGQEINARWIVSNTDPRRTFLSLLDPAYLDPQFVRQVSSIKFRGACAKVHLALDALPRFSGLPGDGPQLSGAISISPSLTYLERAFDDAKYGEISRQPYLEMLIPSLIDPTMAPPGKHVMSILVQYAPYHLRQRAWDAAESDTLGDAVVATLAEYAPNIEAAIEHRHVLTPMDLEQVYGLTEGNIYHGELTLDQLYFMRPTPGWAQYRTPIRSLFLCGAGAHPGGGVTGTPGHNAAREILKASRHR